MAAERVFLVTVKVVSVVEVQVLASERDEAERLGRDAAAAGAGSPLEGEPVTAEVLGINAVEERAGGGGGAW